MVGVAAVFWWLSLWWVRGPVVPRSDPRYIGRLSLKSVFLQYAMVHTAVRVFASFLVAA